MLRVEWPPPAWKIGKLGWIRRAQVCFIPVVAADFVVFGDVEFALVKRDPVRLVEA